MKGRYSWTAHGAPYGVLRVVDWLSDSGPRVVAAVASVEAAVAAVHLLGLGAP